MNLIFDSALANGTASNVDWANAFWDADHAWIVVDATQAISSSGGFSLGAVGNDRLGQPLATIRTSASFATARSGNDIVVTYTAVPEPSTYVLLGIGTTMAGWSIWQRRRIEQLLARKN